ncbi:hypothetical protein PF008_g9558 [Phytophthora fragariae]|uniref:Secreted protein n=1 Tax=Phytophthora fragariae TaxID=53985 RepID=A0A6G0RXU9_9STRA|nr:hypothetical protein PF008_g9558 [Phytophthora fragariae]
MATLLALINISGATKLVLCLNAPFCDFQGESATLHWIAFCIGRFWGEALLPPNLESRFCVGSVNFG